MVAMETALLLSFAVLLLIGVLISERAHRTVLSTAVLFLVGGFLLGPGTLGFIRVSAGDPIVGGLAELALFRSSSRTGCVLDSVTCAPPGGCPAGPCCWDCR